MFEYLKFSIGSMKSGYKTVALRCENGTVEYEIIRSGLLNIEKGTRKACPDKHWYENWEALDVPSWEAVYTSAEVRPGEAWRLIVLENGMTYRSEGDYSWPRQGTQFLEWLDSLMPEMEFIAPNRLELVTFRYQNAHEDRIDHERLEISREKQNVLLEKWWEPKKEGALSQYDVRSSHCYDFSGARDYMSGLLKLCQQYLAPAEFEGAGRFSKGKDTCDPQTIVFLKLHDGSAFNGCVGARYVPGWLEFLEGIHGYIDDLDSNLVKEAKQTDHRQDGQNSNVRYIYCQVRLRNSWRPYSYRTEDETLRVGDWVDVPVGWDNKVIYGQIEKIEYFDEAHVPYPLNRTKCIIGKHERNEEEEEEF